MYQASNVGCPLRGHPTLEARWLHFGVKTCLASVEFFRQIVYIKQAVVDIDDFPESLLFFLQKLSLIHI